MTSASTTFAHSPDDSLKPPPDLRSLAEHRQRATQRVSFDRRGATATGWPSPGGVLLLSANAVDLQFLGASRSEPTPASSPHDPAKEDAWCTQLRRLAPRWVPSRSDWLHATAGGRPMTTLEQQSIYVAWPSSGAGVWILKCTFGREPPGFGAYDTCLSMDERCRVLETFGGRRYSEPSQCPELDERLSKAYMNQRAELDWDEI